ncbi:MAG: hypothetical protein ACRCYU_19850 [Nocardioides sp.]
MRRLGRELLGAGEAVGRAEAGFEQIKVTKQQAGDSRVSASIDAAAAACADAVEQLARTCRDLGDTTLMVLSTLEEGDLCIADELRKYSRSGRHR